MSLSPGPRGQHLELLFDAGLPFGAKDHFFHFLHGYLVPGLAMSLAGMYGSIAFEDCGPLMNPKIADACRLAGLELAAPASGGDPALPAARLVPRWDALLFRRDGAHLSAEDIRTFRALTDRVRRLLLDRATEACRREGTLEGWQCTDILVLRRSPDHPHYAPAGHSRFPRYGSGRRSLVNSAQIADRLAASGRRAREVDMGALPLWDQIAAFDNASAVVGVRGAEFAHLFWMRPGARAVMLATPVRQENHASRSLSEIYGIGFVAPAVAGDFISIDPEEVLRHLG